MYNHIKMNWQKYLQPKSARNGSSKVDNVWSDSSSPPVVYGLGTAYSATFLVLIASFVMLLLMLLGDGVAPGLVLQFLVMILFLELHACNVALEDRGKYPFEI